MEIDTTCLWWYTHNLTVLHCTCLSDIWYLQSLNQFLLYFFPPGMKRFCCEEKKTTSYLFLAKKRRSGKMKPTSYLPLAKKGKWKKETSSYLLLDPLQKKEEKVHVISAPTPLAKEKKKISSPWKKRKEEEKIYVISAPRHLSIAQLFPNCILTLLQWPQLFNTSTNFKSQDYQSHIIAQLWRQSFPFLSFKAEQHFKQPLSRADTTALSAS